VGHHRGQRLYALHVAGELPQHEVPLGQWLQGSPRPPTSNRNGRKTTSECDSSRAFITHRVSDTPGTKIWDVGHLGKFDAGSVTKHFLEFSLTPDQPVGQADGSVIVRNKASIKKRVLGGPGGTTAYYY
jgi:hypothetical protein